MFLYIHSYVPRGFAYCRVTEGWIHVMRISRGGWASARSKWKERIRCLFFVII